MPRVDFYRLTRDPVERVLPVIAGRILGTGDRLLIVAAPAMQRQAIDEALWTLTPASFLPHGAAGSPDEAIEPILIAGTLDPPPPNDARLVALADGEWRDEALGFDRIFLLFDNSRIDDARATWRTLSARADVDNRFWKQDENGRWSEGP
ncbi:MULTISPECIES: DNA polymerase III subunit chi [unclassified Sphingopyxis]|jgi:DNA polymerase III subunit chi|uniref:DNA polymerase III subunit chi n=1 Tax=unclassified Sphingopyxis TaxID=2614943 RepID=UPI002862200E|nr:MULTISPECIES: DNA polymerase III subunit chi [unclassified Sphingopyxis]MDR6832261.1 DNA polymerase-3 subunit chi [Sphingopyxis sp. BE122]MDR7228004.1 DNA polymerase-3 subunit chi [Sphingopyxis sp. BE259]